MQTQIKQLAEAYNRERGLSSIKTFEGLELNKSNALTIADQYNFLGDTWQDKDVILAYNQLKRELIAQFKLLSQYIKFEFVSYDPYKTSAEMFKDIEENKRLKVFTGGQYHKRLKGINKIFRAVHDIFGHYIALNSFSTNGEYKAFKHHSLMFSPLAFKALFTETVAQVCYYSINKAFAPQISVIFKDDIINLI